MLRTTSKPLKSYIRMHFHSQRRWAECARPSAQPSRSKLCLHPATHSDVRSGTAPFCLRLDGRCSHRLSTSSFASFRPLLPCGESNSFAGAGVCCRLQVQAERECEWQLEKEPWQAEQRVQDLKVKKTAQKDVPIERRVTTVELKQSPPNASEEDDCVVGHQIPVAAGFMDMNEAHQSPAIVLARWTTRSNTGNGALHGCKVLEAFGIYWDHQW